jgi:hypothetical protein
VRHLAGKHERVVNRATKLTTIGLLALSIPAAVTSDHIVRAIQSGASGKALQDQIIPPAFIGGIIFLLVSSYFYSGIRRMAACCIQTKWPEEQSRAQLRDPFKQTMRRWWDSFLKIHPAIATLTGIVGVLLAIIVAIFG